jgi:hypothetical protein
MLLDDFHGARGFRMGGQECRHGRRIRLAGTRHHGRGDQPVIETLRRTIEEDRKTQRRHPPLLTARESERQTKPARRRGRVSDLRVAAGQGESTDHRRAAGRKHRRLGQAAAVAVAVEPARNGHPFGVVLAESRMPAEHLGETVEENLLRQPGGTDPGVRAQQRCQVGRQERSHRGGTAQQVAPPGSRDTPTSGGLGWFAHRSAPSILVGRSMPLASTTIVGHRFNCGRLELGLPGNHAKTDSRGWPK